MTADQTTSPNPAAVSEQEIQDQIPELKWERRSVQVTGGPKGAF